jgi:hypothetical protein
MTVNFMRCTALLVALLGGGLMAAVPAAAATGPHVTVSPAAGPSGTVVTVTGSGFCASGCTPVTILFNGNLAQSNVAVSANGSFSVTATVGSGAGTVEVLAMQTHSTETIQAITYFESTPNVAAPPGKGTPAPSRQASPGAPTPLTSATTPPTTSSGSAQNSSTALAGAKNSDGGPSALVLALGVLGGVLVLGAGGFAVRQITRRRTSG